MRPGERYLEGVTLAAHWSKAKERLLAVRRRSWAVATLVCLGGWTALLALSSQADEAHWWWRALDFPLNAGWVFCSFAACGLLQQAFQKPRYVIAKRPPLWKTLLDGVGALVLLALLLLLGAGAGYGMVVMLGPWGWLLDGLALALLGVRTYFGVRQDLRARQEARQRWLSEQGQQTQSA
jgi:hypothetical protein